MNKRFRITVVEEVYEEQPAGCEWKETGEDNPKYAYTPAIITTKKVVRKLYEQDVDDLDLQEVIRAVNYL